MELQAGMVSPNDSHVLDETVCTQIKGRAGLMGIDKGLDVGIESKRKKKLSPSIALFSDTPPSASPSHEHTFSLPLSL